MSDAKYNAPITLSTLMVVGVSVLTATPIILGGSSRAESLSITTQEPATPPSHLILPAGTLWFEEHE
ncbi:hypothetical protein PCC7424_5299 [Gloeothece citriformis PCC 7424]|uniref:Uncharacterized protein n=1 Tax=Gloeothece citriformis (strain PCC 7424) TaxID=65393 RepID=B7KJH0_GLOC7|nr:hypothetical protein [Gloeothece citriformis]ACK73647.1 hypothetical protein PCC7424_5299 [Gloeothece citriformis PCC 7424]